MHRRDLRYLAIEMFKVVEEISPLMLNELFGSNKGGDN